MTKSPREAGAAGLTFTFDEQLSELVRKSVEASDPRALGLFVRDAVLSYLHLAQLREAGFELIARRASDGREARLRLPDEMRARAAQAQAAQTDAQAESPQS